MKRERGLILLLFIIAGLCSALVQAHAEDSAESGAAGLYPLTQWQAVGYGSLAFFIMIAVILLSGKKMNDTQKRVSYFLLAGITLAVTFYLVIMTVHLNIISETKGPVHWHADFEIWLCDAEINLKDPHGLSNKIGTPLLHEHNDNRIHVEGVVMEKEDVSLGNFFHAIGGDLSFNSIAVPTNEGIVTKENGNLCGDKTALLHVFVNGKEIQNPEEYVLAGFERVPPGDRIKIVFSEKDSADINPYIKSEQGA